MVQYQYQYDAMPQRMMLCNNNGFVNNHVIQCYESYYGCVYQHIMVFSFYDTRIGLGSARPIHIITTLWFFFYDKMFEGSLSDEFLS
jgi:hypothetical protein